MKTAIVSLAIISASLAAAPVASAADEVIRFGVAAEPYPPFSVKNAAGVWEGWEVDLMDAVCEEMDAECVIVDVPWDGIIPALLENKFDVIWSSMSITDERMKVIDFTDKYYFSPNVLVGAKADPRAFDIEDPETMKGLVLGAQSSSTQASYLQQELGGIADLKLYPTLDDEIADLKAGRIDMMAAGGIQIQSFLDTPDGEAYEIKVTMPQVQMFGYGDGGGLRKEDTALKEQLNEAIAAVRASGKYDEITEQYFDIDIYGE